MSQKQDLLREIAAANNSGAPDRIRDWFTGCMSRARRPCRWVTRVPAKCGRDSGPSYRQ
jgi:hypothetical protein